jgi:glycosyltransferase involved in cell wall biosynthesis
VIPTRNRPNETQRAIASVIRQRGAELCQIVVVDDCSDFDYELENLREQDLFIKLKKKTTAAHARNVGIKHADGEVIYLLDSDDYFIKRDFLNDYDVVKDSNALFFCEYHPKFQGGSFPTEVRENDYFKYIFCNYEGIANTCSLVFAKTSGFRFDDDLPKHQDWDFVYFNVIKKGLPLLKIDGEVYIDRSDKKSVSRTRDVNRSIPWLNKLKAHLNDEEYSYVSFCICCGFSSKISWWNFIYYGIGLILTKRLKVSTWLKRCIQRLM